MHKLALHLIHCQALMNTLRDPSKYIAQRDVEIVGDTLSDLLDQIYNPRDIV